MVKKYWVDDRLIECKKETEWFGEEGNVKAILLSDLKIVIENRIDEIKKKSKKTRNEMMISNLSGELNALYWVMEMIEDDC